MQIPSDCSISANAQHLQQSEIPILCHNNVLIDQDISLILEAIKMQSKRGTLLVRQTGPPSISEKYKEKVK